MKLDRAITGDKLILRDYEKADLDFCTGMWFDPENGKYLSDPTAEHVDEVYQKALDAMEGNQDGCYLIAERKDTGETVGTCCAFPDGEGKTWDIGYCVRKSCWRQGYGTEIVKLLTGWLRERGAESMTAEAAVENAGSCKLLENSGFAVQRESTFKKYGTEQRFKSYVYQKKL